MTAGRDGRDGCDILHVCVEEVNTEGYRPRNLVSITYFV